MPIVIPFSDAEVRVARQKITKDLRPVGDEFEATQEHIEHFAIASGDFNPLHIDPVAAERGPYRKIIAHGFLTVSRVAALANHMRPFELFENADCALTGADKIRFWRPLTLGKTIRCIGRLVSVRRQGNCVAVNFAWEVNLGAGRKVASGVFRLNYRKHAETNIAVAA